MCVASFMCLYHAQEAEKLQIELVRAHVDKAASMFHEHMDRMLELFTSKVDALRAEAECEQTVLKQKHDADVAELEAIMGMRRLWLLSCFISSAYEREVCCRGRTSQEIFQCCFRKCM